MMSIDVGQMLQITWSGSSRSAVQGLQEEEPRGREREGRQPGGKGGKSDLAGNNNSNP